MYIYIYIYTYTGGRAAAPSLPPEPGSSASRIPPLRPRLSEVQTSGHVTTGHSVETCLLLNHPWLATKIWGSGSCRAPPCRSKFNAFTLSFR